MAHSRSLAAALRGIFCLTSLLLVNCSAGAAPPGQLTGQDFLDRIVSIAKHGELRDIEFAENALSTKITVSREDLNLDYIEDIPALISIQLRSSDNKFDTKFLNYSIFIERYKGTLEHNGKYNIAYMQMEHADNLFCVSPRLLMSRYNLSLSALRPGIPFVPFYEFNTKVTNYYRTFIYINDPDKKTGCSSLFSVIQEGPHGS